MWRVAFGVVVGVILAPQLKQLLRPAVRGAVKASVRAGHQIQRVTAEIKEDFEDLAADASEESGPEPK